MKKLSGVERTKVENFNHTELSVINFCETLPELETSSIIRVKVFADD